MRIRSLLTVVFVSSSASMLSPVGATTAPAKLLARQSFTTGTDGWEALPGAQLVNVVDPVDQALAIQGTARSPLIPSGTMQIQYHFRHMAPECCDYARLMRLENAAGDAMITVDNYGSTLVISGSTVILRTSPPDHAWHRIDAIIGDTDIRILFDGSEKGRVAPAVPGPVARAKVTSELEAPLRIDEVRLFGEGKPRQESFYSQPPISVESVDRGSNGRQEVLHNIVSVRDSGFLRVSGSNLPDELHYVKWPVEGLGNNFESGVEFRISNSFRPPDHFAVLGGLSSSGEPLWAITLSNVLDPSGSSPVGGTGLFFVSGSRIERLPYTFRGSTWRSIRATTDLEAGTLTVENELGSLASIAGLPSGTHFLAAGDVFPSFGPPVTFDGYSPLGPTGIGTIDLDGLYSAPL